MTTVREAAQQALEALEPYADIKPRDWKTDREKLWRSYDALRAALAEQTCKEHLQVEPVAWMDIADDGTRLDVRMWSDGNREEVPLYTAPPQRKPLTEPLSAAIESILHTDDLSEEIHQAQINSLRAAYDAAKSKHGGRNEST